jgi:hypothetical protein
LEGDCKLRLLAFDAEVRLNVSQKSSRCCRMDTPYGNTRTPMQTNGAAPRHTEPVKHITLGLRRGTMQGETLGLARWRDLYAAFAIEESSGIRFIYIRHTHAFHLSSQRHEQQY